MTDDGQLTREDVLRLSKAKKYAEIEAARKAGRLAVLLGGQASTSPSGRQWTAEEVSTAYRGGRYSDIEAARQRGELVAVLGGNANDAT